VNLGSGWSFKAVGAPSASAPGRFADFRRIFGAPTQSELQLRDLIRLLGGVMRKKFFVIAAALFATACVNDSESASPMAPGGLPKSAVAAPINVASPETAAAPPTAAAPTTAVTWRAKTQLNQNKSTGGESCRSTATLYYTLTFTGDYLIGSRGKLPVREDGSVEKIWQINGSGDQVRFFGYPRTRDLTITNMTYGCVYDIIPMQ
jgi:hypothetical protein